MSFCHGRSSKVLVHGEFQQYVKYKDVGKSEEGKTHRRYEVDDLPLSYVYPDSDLDHELKGKVQHKKVEAAKSAQAVRVFRFLTNGEARVMEIRHKDCYWYIVIDGVVKRVVCHQPKVKDKTTVAVQFEVPEYRDEVHEAEENRKGKTLHGVARMRWSSGKTKWSYAVSVNNIPIPAMWSILAEDTQKSVYLPDVLNESKNIYSVEELCKGNHEWRRVFDDSDLNRSVTRGASESGGEQLLDEYKTVRLWRFTMERQLRGVEVAHKKAIWSILVDGIEVKRLNRSQERSEKGKYGCDFPIRLKRDNGTSPACDGHLMIEWSRSGFRWEYYLMVNSVFIPQCGFKGSPIAPYDFYSIDVPEIPVPMLAVTDTPAKGSGWLAMPWGKSLQDDKESNKSLSKEYGHKKAVKSTTPFKAARTYHFTTNFTLRTVSILHSGCVWRFVVDGKKAPALNVVQGPPLAAGKEQLTHSSNIFKTMHYEVTFEIPYEGGTLTEPLKASCKMSWAPRDARWRYELKVRVAKANSGPVEFELFPMFDVANPAKQGQSGSGAIIELIETEGLGLKGWRPNYQSIADEAETILAKLHQAGDNQISIENSGSSFQANDYIKIEGLTDADPQEYRQIVSIQWTDNKNGVIVLNQVLDCTHELGSRVRRVAKGDVPEEDKDQRCEHEIQYILHEKLRGADGDYGIRFMPGSYQLASEAETAVQYDISSLLLKFPSYYIKIIGYTAKPSENDVYNDTDALKYLAMKRCETVMQLLRFKEVENLIGIEGRGYDPSKPACCLIERSDREEIDELNARAEEFFKEAEMKGLHRKFVVESSQDWDGTTPSNCSFTDSSLVVSSRARFSAVTRTFDSHLKGSRSELGIGESSKSKENHSQSFLSPVASTLSLVSANGLRSFSDREASTLEYRSALTQSGLVNQSQIDVINYYKPGEEIEYFSRTHTRWMSAAIENVVLDEEFQVRFWTEAGVKWAKDKQQEFHESKIGDRRFESLPEVNDIVSQEQVVAIGRFQGDIKNKEHFRVEVSQCFYDIVFGRSGKRRGMVGIDSIRKPLSENTDVEIYSKKNGGTWLTGIINGPQIGAATVGYNVIVQIPGQADFEVERLPAERIRRRFEEGTDVEFYVNANIGWKRAKVALEAGDGCVGDDRDGVKELRWLCKTDFQEAVLNTVGDNKDQESSLPGPPQDAKEVPLEEDDDDDMAMGNRTMGHTHDVPEEAPTQRVLSQAQPIGVEPWTAVPIIIDDVDAKELGLDTTLRIELWRLRMPEKLV